MGSYDDYQYWLDKLLTVISNEICSPCEDPRKEKYALDFESPLNCSCCCERVESILENAKQIDEDINRYAENNKGQTELQPIKN